VIPKTDVVTTPAPVPAPEPSATALPTDTGRHRIALLVPMSGDTAPVGQAIANATTMALLDTNADSLRITTYDTSQGVSVAAQNAIADGNKLILGPLSADAVPDVRAAARPAGVPVIAFADCAMSEVFTKRGIPFDCEFYADLDYDDSGRQIISKRHHAVSAEDVALKVDRALREGVVRSVDGKDVAVVADSICVHSDTPNALEVARAVHAVVTKVEGRMG
jgi:hypothetical protein